MDFNLLFFLSLDKKTQQDCRYKPESGDPTAELFSKITCKISGAVFPAILPRYARRGQTKIRPASLVLLDL